MGMCGCNQKTTCNSCTQTSYTGNNSYCTDCCNNTCSCSVQPCGCEVELDAACIRYTGEDLSCAGITKGDTVETALQAIGEKLCNFSGSYVTVLDEAAGVNCENGGVVINVYDSESDALTGSTYICTPSTNYITVVEEAAGANCSEGGVAVNTYDADDVIIDTVYICTSVCECPPVLAKENFYEQTISSVNIAADPTFISLTYFQPVGYTNLAYTNTSGTTKDYIVNVSYETSTLPANINSPEILNWVDGAIIKTVSAVDSIQYESLNTTQVSIYLFDGTTVNDTITLSSIAPDQVLTTAGNDVEIRFLNGKIPKNTSFFKKITLNNNESVSLKFKTKDGSVGWLLSAQMFVNELD